MDNSQSIIDAAQFVVDRAKDVHIDQSKIPLIVPKIAILESVAWSGSADIDYSQFDDEELMRYFILRESLNFCFWDSKPKWKIKHNGNWYSGSYGLLYALNQAIHNNPDILNPNYLSRLSFKEFNEIFTGTTTIPLAKERYDIIQGLSQELQTAGKLAELFDVDSDEELLARVVTNFQNFRDVSLYDNREIFFYKRAILLVTDLISHVKMIQDKIKNNDHMPGCADYKAPQALRQLGVLNYSPKLADKIDRGVHIEHDSKPEIEIRAATLIAIELIKQNFIENGQNVNSVQVDNALWLLSKQPEFKAKPYHLTRTIYY